MESWSLSESGLSAEEASSGRRYTFGNLVTMVLFAIALVAFLNAAILALAWSKKPFLGFVVEPTLVVSNVGGVSWNAQTIGLDYPERITQIGESNVLTGQEYINIAEDLSIGSPVGRMSMPPAIGEVQFNLT